jgi:hypothetical protein
MRRLGCRLATHVVIGMAIQAPRRYAQVVGQQKVMESGVKFAAPLGDVAVGQAKASDDRLQPTEASKSRFRLAGANVGQAQKRCDGRFGMRRLTVRDSDHFDEYPLIEGLLDQSSGAKNLVVGMRSHDHQPPRVK